MALTFILFSVVLFILFRKLFNKKKPNETIPDEDSPSDTEFSPSDTEFSDTKYWDTEFTPWDTEFTPSDTEFTADSSSLSLRGEYEVFLSFRGEDTRKGFTDYLYTSLVGAGIRTFRDDDKLRIGEEIGPDLLRAIDVSKILIPILSKNYAGSKWCLIELAKMVECHKTKGKTIFPIFYDVKPSDVRNQKGNNEKVFRQHEKRFGKVIVQGWKNAMTLVGKQKGLELEKATNGHEGELVKMVVKEVILMLKKNYTTLPDGLVGMDHHVSEMETLLDVKYNGTRIVGILGMGGIGKTTISKVVFNRLCDSFDRCCFLDDVRERSKHHNGVVTLQNELVSQITKQELIGISNSGEGIGKIRDMLSTMKVLIVFDDIDSISQINQLIGGCESICDGSKIMITTRNKDVLDIIEKTYREKDGASGLPLVLVTLGSLLFGVNDKEIWEERVQKLKKVPNKDVLEKLRISYDALDHGQQQIFLDIACLFYGAHKKYASYMWDACGYYPKSGLDTLVRRSLIRVGDDNKMWMHDQLIDLGKQIVREENLKEAGMRSRVWETEEALDALNGCLGSNNIEALQIKRNELDPICFVREDFSPTLWNLLFEESLESSVGEWPLVPYQLQNLRYMKPRDVGFHEVVQSYFTELENKKSSVWNLEFEQSSRSSEWEQPLIPRQLQNLRYLEFEQSSRSSEWEQPLIPQRQLQNLRYLKLKDVELDGDFQNPFPKLRFLEYRSSAIVFNKTKFDNGRDFIPTNLILKNLVVLKLSFDYYTKHISERTSLFEAITQARKLKALVLVYCNNSQLNLSTFKDLEILEIESCNSLWKVAGLSETKRLKEATFCDCDSLTELQGLEKLEVLELLRVEHSRSIRRLPDLSKFKVLKQLHLKSLVSLHEIGGIEELKSLESLEISCCTPLRTLLKLSHLTCLKNVKLSVCSLKELNCLGWISLENLELRDCDFHENTLESLSMSGCNFMKRLPNLSKCTSLRHLSLPVCSKLTDTLQHGLISLEMLELSHCGLHDNKVESVCIFSSNTSRKLLKFSPLTGSNELVFSGCEKLVEIKIRLKLLERLICIGSLGNALDVSYSKHLKKLVVRDSENLKEISGLEELISLEVLDVSDCSSLEKLPDLSNLSNLKALYDMNCKVLRVVGVYSLVSLQFLHLSGCRITHRTFDFSFFKYLKEIKISYPYVLTEIKGLEELISLEKLWIYDCFCLEKLSDLSNLTNLRDFKLRGCTSLSLLEIKGFNHLVSLVYLEISSLFKMENFIVDFSSLINLMELNLSGLTHLIKITGLEKSKSLEVLNVSNCRSLEELPDLSGIASFRHLNIGGCVNLPQIKGLSSSVFIINS